MEVHKGRSRNIAMNDIEEDLSRQSRSVLSHEANHGSARANDHQTIEPERWVF